MNDPDYSRVEEHRIVNAVRAGESVACPRCGHPMEERDVPPKDHVAYVRHRLWLHCIECRRGIVVDRPR